MSRSWLYHEFLAPQGDIFEGDEIRKRTKEGWVDSPSKFGSWLGRGLRWPFYKIVVHIRMFWNDHWKWIIGTFLAILAVIAQYIKD